MQTAFISPVSSLFLRESVKRAVAKLQASRILVKVNAPDLRIKMIKGSGPGGQAVNKTNNCIDMLHEPTGVRIKCHATRYAELNKNLGKKLITKELDKRLNGPASKERLRTLLRVERKRVKQKKSAKKHRLAKELREQLKPQQDK